MTQHCNECGKEFKNNNRAIAITTGYIDYKNYQGFKSDENDWLIICCPKCYDKRNAKLSNLIAILKEFIGDVESCYGSHPEKLHDATSLDKEWYDLARTYDKAKKIVNGIK